MNKTKNNTVALEKRKTGLILKSVILILFTYSDYDNFS